LEAAIIAREERLAIIEKDLYKEEIYMDHTQYKNLEKEALKLKKELNDLYEEWDTWA